ncbi:MAG: DNA-processing protein DprA, partial [Candidatus Hinthialibacter sp.]
MDAIVLLQLMQIPGIGHATLNRLLFRVQRNGMSPGDLLDMRPDDLVDQYNFQREWAESFLGGRRKSERMAEELAAHQIQIIPSDHPQYPTRLQEILGDGAPPVLFVRGNADLLREHSAAVVGSRRCSLRGVKSARHCVRQLVEKNLAIVSGNAAGVDA